jgi:hypothetical protein
MAMVGPPVLFGAVLAGAWRWRGGPWAVGVLLLVAALAWLTGFADGAVLLRYLDVITTTVELAGPAAVLQFFLVGGLLRGLFGTHTLLQARTGRPPPAWMRRRGVLGDGGGGDRSARCPTAWQGSRG